MPTFQGLGGKSLAAGQVADREGGGGEGGDNERQAMKDESCFHTADESLFADVSVSNTDKFASFKCPPFFCFFGYFFLKNSFCVLQCDDKNNLNISRKKKGRRK